MKFAHFADLHLGYEQYNLSWRTEDFANAFRRAAEIAVSEGVDFAIIAGDLFHKSVPNPKTLNEAIEVLKIFKKNSVPVFAVEGNHDKSIREISAYHLLESLELLNLLGLRRERAEGEYLRSVKVENVYLVKGLFDGVEIVGEKHRTRWQLEKVLPHLKLQKADILVLHQAVKEAIDIDMNIAWDLTIEQLPKARYYALGHVHMQREMRIGDSYLVYPGSIERYDSREASLFISFGERLERREGWKKGFYIVENFKPRFVPLETRELYSISIDAQKRSEAEKKFIDVLGNLKNTGIGVVKIICEENVDTTKLTELALKSLKHVEISFKRRYIEEIVTMKPEKEFFSDFEMKLLEVLRDEELSLNAALELIKEYYGLEKEKKEEKVVETLKGETEIKEKREKKFRTLLDFI
ncbi:MAG: exonuclease SbcCD subunit D [Archaeoglobaceae archaeon]